MSLKPSEPLSRRKVWVGKSLWRSSCPIPYSKHIQLQYVVQGLVCLSFEYLQNQRCHYLSNACSNIYHHHGEKMFPKIWLEFMFLQFVSFAFVSLLYTSEKSLSLFPSSYHYIAGVSSEILQPFSSWGWTSLTPSPNPHISTYFWISAFSVGFSITWTPELGV